MHHLAEPSGFSPQILQVEMGHESVLTVFARLELALFTLGAVSNEGEGISKAKRNSS